MERIPLSRTNRKSPTKFYILFGCVKRGRKEKGKETRRKNTSFYSFVEEKKKKKENGVSHFLPRLTNFDPPKFKDKSIMKMCTKNVFTILPFENHLTFFFFSVLWTIVNPNKLSFPLFHFFSSIK